MAKRKKKDIESVAEPKIQEDKKPEPKVVKKVESKSIEPKFVDDEEPTTNMVLLRNRYDKAMLEVKEILSNENKKKEYLSQKEFKFKFVGVGGSMRFINEGKFVIADMNNPYVYTKDKGLALMLLESEKFKIIK